MAASGRISRALRAVNDARHERMRRPPALTVGRGGSRPVVYYLTPDDNAPRGGIRVNYRHVDLLNRDGIPAAVLHSRPGFRCDWFANDTRVSGAGEVTVAPHDLLVVPEYYASQLHLLPAGPRKVLFNQNAYHTFTRLPFDARAGRASPYTGLPNLVAMLAVSEDNAALLGYTFPDTPVSLVRNMVDGRVFHPAAGPPGRRIAYLPRRGRHRSNQLLHMLAHRGLLDGWELVAIDGRSEQETAQLMRDSAIFLSFSEREGFGMPPAEAMASGCYVVGFTGLGGREYFDPAYCTPVAEDDLLACALAAQEAIRRYDTDPDGLIKAGRLASERILGRYHEDGLRRDLLAFYRPLVGDRPAVR
jgi:hypothetical protein